MLSDILRDLRAHVRLHAQVKLLLPLAILLLCMFGLNYSLDLEDSHVDRISSPWLKWLAMLAFQGLPYLTACGIMAFGGWFSWRTMDKGFWLSFSLGFGLLALDRSLNIQPLLRPLLEIGGASSQQVWFGLSLLKQIAGLFTIIVPLLAAYSLLLSGRPAFRLHKAALHLGLSFSGFKILAYAKLLGLAAVIVGIGILFADIQAFYPKYGRSGGEAFAQASRVPEWLAVLTYELCYGFDFLSTEFFFRGFLVLGMYKYLGPHAIIPMAITYAALHFGKPMPEAIGSIFGGYLLGVLALHHRNIWGGVLIHVGMAWMMELAGFLYK